MIIDSDLTDKIALYRNNMKQVMNKRDNAAMYNELEDLSLLASGEIPIPMHNPIMMKALVGFALIGYHDIRQEILRERQTAQ